LRDRPADRDENITLGRRNIKVFARWATAYMTMSVQGESE